MDTLILLTIYNLFTLTSAHLYLWSSPTNCSKVRPFQVLPDDGSKSAMLESELSPNGTNNNIYNVNFYLYTRTNPDTPYEINMNNMESVRKAKYASNTPLMVVVHGWLGSSITGSAKIIRSSVFHANVKTNYTVLVVDWSGPASDQVYDSVRRKVPYIGQRIGDLLNWLIKSTKASWDDVHLVGYDMGAHIVGQAARNTNGRVRRITGLDPLAPCFSGLVDSLSKSDGDYVEVIHTDCAFIRSVGIVESIGHVDFYPNNCNIQPGCTDYVCSHTRAYELFAATVVYDQFIGVKCSNYWDALKSTCDGTETLNMGNIDVDKNGEGVYSLITNSDWPFTETSDSDLEKDWISKTLLHKEELRELVPTLAKDFWGHG